MKIYRTFSFLLLITLATNCISQTSILKKNTIALAPLNLLSRTLSISYSRDIKPNWKLIINPRIKFKQFHSNFYSNDLFDYHVYIEQPLMYSRIFLRSGLLYYKKRFFVGPLLQLDHGWIINQTFDMGSGDDYDATIDRDYSSLGLIGLTGLFLDYNKLRVKFYTGIGTHLFYFNEIKKSGGPPPPEGFPIVTKYKKIKPSIHLGVELGIKF